MATALKLVYSEEFLQNLAFHTKAHLPSFDSASFIKSTLAKPWHDLELKARMHRITSSLQKHLPQDYPEALKVLAPVAEHFSSYEAMFFPDFVEQYGLNHWTESMKALEHFTKFSSSEFAVRPFIIKSPKKMMTQMAHWAKSENHHVRRLASEGCRPRLPWAMALPDFKQDPSAILPILEVLKDDPSEYVRRSVANNLNDIAKDHPQLVYNIAKKWLGHSIERDKLVKHACRTLLKAGNSPTMRLFGYTATEHIELKNFTWDQEVSWSGELNFDFDLTCSTSLGKLRIEYAIGFLRKNGLHSRKVFKISEGSYDQSHKHIKKRHSFKAISTRVYYPGIQKIILIINGVDYCEFEFTLKSN